MVNVINYADLADPAATRIGLQCNLVQPMPMQLNVVDAAQFAVGFGRDLMRNAFDRDPHALRVRLKDLVAPVIGNRRKLLDEDAQNPRMLGDLRDLLPELTLRVQHLRHQIFENC